MRRAFSLLETILAAALGSLVVVGVMGIISMLDRADTSAALRTSQTNEMLQAQTVIRRALGSLAMAGGNAPVQRTTTTGDGGNAEAAPVTTQSGFTPSPRFVLGSMSASGTAAAEGTVTSGPQRLELALTSLPLPERAFLPPTSTSTTRETLAPIDPNEASAEEQGDLLFDPLDGESEGEVDEDALADTSELVPIFRGAFELTPSRPSLTGEVDGYTLWWRQLPTTTATTATGAESSAATAMADASQQVQVPQDPRDDPNAIPLITGLSSCRWSVYKSRQLSSSFTATYSGDLPAYVQVELQTTGGVYANWMFEVGWATVREPGQQDPAATMGGAAGRGGRGGAGGGPRPPGEGGQPGGSRGPRRGFERQDGRPAPTPQQTGGGR